MLIIIIIIIIIIIMILIWGKLFSKMTNRSAQHRLTHTDTPAHAHTRTWSRVCTTMYRMRRERVRVHESGGLVLK